MTEVTTMTSSIQWGFAGFAFALLTVLSGVLVWLSKTLVSELRDSNQQKVELVQVVSNNTAAITALNKTGDSTMDLMVEVKDLLLAKPCMAEEREKAK